jgi:hypothetical protein
MSGDGPMSYLCGSCGTVLLQGIDYKEAGEVVIRCGKCRQFNEIPISHHTN